MSLITAKCYSCGQLIDLPDDNGALLPCPKCGNSLNVKKAIEYYKLIEHYNGPNTRRRKITSIYGGTMSDFRIRDDTLLWYSGSDEVVVIPPTVRRIAYKSFYLKDMKKLIIPYYVTEVKKEAFIKCEQLTHVTMPRRFTKVKAMFSGCTRLKKENCTFTDSFDGGSSDENAGLSDVEKDAKRVIEALQRRLKKETSVSEYTDELWIAMLRREDDLRAFMEEYDELKASADKLAAEHKKLENEAASLHREREKLNFFQGRRKKEIDNQLITVNRARKEAEYSSNAATRKLLGYASREELERDHEETLCVIRECERIRSALRTGGGYTFGFNSALASYNNNKDVASAVDKMLGPSAQYFLAQFGLRDYVTFGRCIQSNSGKEAEPIEWIVGGEIGREKHVPGMILLISRYALDCRPFDKNGEREWYYSSLRKWLNSEFLNEAFSEKEQSVILDRTFEYNHRFEVQGTTRKVETIRKEATDKVFILCATNPYRYADTVTHHFALDSTFNRRGDLCCKPTGYAASKGAVTKDGVCAWWTDSDVEYIPPGRVHHYFTKQVVPFDGSLKDNTNMANCTGIEVFPGELEDKDYVVWDPAGYAASPECEQIGVRPVLRMDVSSLEKLKEAFGEE